MGQRKRSDSGHIGKSIRLRELNCLETASKEKHWVVWCRSKGEEDDFRPFEADGKEIFSSEDEMESDAKKKKNRWSWKRGYRGQSVQYELD